jgi:putative nucleotidyltransferase with HDIG domain
MSKITETPIGRKVALAILGIAFVASTSALVAYNALVPAEGVELATGQVAPADIIAPRSTSYDSDVLTKLARQAAADAIRDVYDPPNPSVARQQIQLARHVLDYIDNVRHDSYATVTQQTADLQSITALKVDDMMAANLLKLPDDIWKQVDGQVMGILDRVMRNEVRENDLNELYANLPNLVSVTVDEANTSVITSLVKDLIKPNTFYNEERTTDARKQAAAAITTERRTFAQGQVVVRAGSIVTDADMEALTQLKLLQPTDRRIQAIVGAFLAMIILSTLGVLYLRRLHTALYQNVPQMVFIGGVFVIFLAGMRIFGTASEFQSHLYPAAAFSLIVLVLTGPQAALILTGAFAAVVGLIMGNSLEFTLLVALSGAAGILSLHRVERLNAYFVAGLVISITNVAVGTLFMLIQGNVDPVTVVVVLAAGLLNGVLSAGLAIVGLYLISGVLNMPTPVRLIDLSQPNQPLLQRLLREAPGTYQHSLQVANLAELAAERIGANAALVRVAALYHDIGKIAYPHFFVENQAEGVNPHDNLNDPYRSAQIIISHVTEGEKLARKHHLPSVLIDGIMQHHGTTPVLYFYNQALKAVDCDTTRVNKPAFCYPGPCPRTRESAILMLADSSESIVRAKRPQTKQEIEDIVLDIIESRISESQLDSSGLTINDLKVIREVFVSTLQGVFHPRIVYPATPVPGEAAQVPVTATATVPAVAPAPAIATTTTTTTAVSEASS